MIPVEQTRCISLPTPSHLTVSIQCDEVVNTKCPPALVCGLLKGHREKLRLSITIQVHWRRPRQLFKRGSDRRRGKHVSPKLVPVSTVEGTQFQWPGTGRRLGGQDQVQHSVDV